MLIPVWLSLSVHEWAHAYTAYRLGDDTAARQGRMTVNPLAHIDPVGTLLLPLLGIPFGWAKPVPIDPVRFDRRVSMGTGMALAAAAGPFSNFLLALGAALAVWGITGPLAGDSLHGGTVRLLYQFAFVNAALGLFNLFPIPPLDGSRVAEALVPERLRGVWDSYASLAPGLLIALIAVPAFLHVSLLDWPLRHVRELLDAIVFRRG